MPHLPNKDHPSFKHKKMEHIPDFDVLSEDPETTATILKERLQDIGIKKVKTEKKSIFTNIFKCFQQIVMFIDILPSTIEKVNQHLYIPAIYFKSSLDYID